MRLKHSPGIIIAFLLLCFGCQSTKNMPTQGETSFKPSRISAIPSERPEWVDNVPSSTNSIYFVGISDYCNTENTAREEARNNAYSQIVSYYGSIIKNEASGKKSVKILNSSDVDTYIEMEELIQTYAERYISQIQATNYYTEEWQISADATGYQTWVLCTIPRSKAEEDINSFAENISERFSALLPEKQNGKFLSTKSAVEAYLDAYEAINQNPIYQAVAYVKTDSGKVSFDDYAMQQAKRIIQNCTIQNINYTEHIGKGDTFKMTVHLSSADYPTITGVSADFVVLKNGNTLFSSKYEVNNKNDIDIIIDTKDYDYGDYECQIKLYSDSFPDLGTVHLQNSSAVFTIDLIHAGIDFIYSGIMSGNNNNNDIEQKIKDILQEQLNRYNAPLVLDETANSYSSWKFVVKINGVKQTSAADVYKINLKETILLQQNGITKCQTEEFSGTGLSKIENSSVIAANEQCTKKLAESERFFQSILNITGEK